MTNLTHARRMLMHDEPADEFFPPETTVFLTSTISDDELMDYSFADEVRTVAAFAPDYCLPFDFPVYGDMDEETRMEHIRQVGGGTLDIARLFGTDDETGVERLADEVGVEPATAAAAREADTEIVPLIKGTTPAERNVMERVAEEIDASMIAKYGTQYMTVGGSGNYPELRRVLKAIGDETDDHPLILVGLLSPTGKYSLEGLPDNVIGAAGLNQWRKPVDPANNSPSAMREAYATLDREVADALGRAIPYAADEASATEDSPPSAFKRDHTSAVSEDGGEFGAEIAGAVETPEVYGFGGRKREREKRGSESERDDDPAGSVG